MSIRAEQIDYSYGRRRVLHSLDLDVGVGATLLLGPNGAGKSTLLEVLASVRRAARGSVTIAGVGAPGPDRAALQRYRRAVAWLPQTVTPYPGVRVREHVALAGWLKGMSKAEAWEASARALEQVALSDKATDPVKSLSGGQTRRLGIAGALVHDARVILLDEPTASLDPAQRRRFRSVIEPIAAERTVLISSHDIRLRRRARRRADAFRWHRRGVLAGLSVERQRHGPDRTRLRSLGGGRGVTRTVFPLVAHPAVFLFLPTLALEVLFGFAQGMKGWVSGYWVGVASSATEYMVFACAFAALTSALVASRIAAAVCENWRRPARPCRSCGPRSGPRLQGRRFCKAWDC